MTAAARRGRTGPRRGRGGQTDHQSGCLEPVEHAESRWSMSQVRVPLQEEELRREIAEVVRQPGQWIWVQEKPDPGKTTLTSRMCQGRQDTG